MGGWGEGGREKRRKKGRDGARGGGEGEGESEASERGSTRLGSSDRRREGVHSSPLAYLTRPGCFFQLVLILWLIGRKYRTRPGLIRCQVMKTKRNTTRSCLVKNTEEIKKSEGYPSGSLFNSRRRDLFRSGSSTLDPDNRRLLPARDPGSFSDADAPGDRVGNRGSGTIHLPGASEGPEDPCSCCRRCSRNDSAFVFFGPFPGPRRRGPPG
jgi:hypothetical protein